MTPAFGELLWIFTQLPDDYVVLDTETTGLPDENGLPDIVSLGITVVRQREIREMVEFMTRPQKPISAGAQSVHGINDDEAAAFDSFGSQCASILGYLKKQLVVIHNASFDWPLLLDQTTRSGFGAPTVTGVFCSQKAAMPWALASGLPCSVRGPSLDVLVHEIGEPNLRESVQGKHRAGLDSRQTAGVVERLRHYAEATGQ